MSCKVFALAILACVILPTMSIVLLKPKHAVPHYRIHNIGLHRMRFPTSVKRQSFLGPRQQPLFVPSSIPIRRQPFLRRRPPPFTGFKKLHFVKKKPLITKLGRFPMKFKSPLKVFPLMPKSTRFNYPGMRSKQFHKKPIFLPHHRLPMKSFGKERRRFHNPVRIRHQRQKFPPQNMMPGGKINSFSRAPRPNYLQMPNFQITPKHPTLTKQAHQHLKANSHQPNDVRYPYQQPYQQDIFRSINSQGFMNNGFVDGIRDDFDDIDHLKGDDDKFDDTDFDDISREGILGASQNNQILKPHDKDFEDDIHLHNNKQRHGYYGSRGNKRSSPAVFGLDDDKLEKIHDRSRPINDPFTGIQGAFQQPWGGDNNHAFQQPLSVGDHLNSQQPQTTGNIGAFQQPQNFVQHGVLQKSPNEGNHGQFQQSPNVGNQVTFQQPLGVGNHETLFQQPWDRNGDGSPFSGLDDHKETHFDDTIFPNDNFDTHDEPKTINAIDPFARQMEKRNGDEINSHVPDIHRTDQSNFRFETEHQSFLQPSHAGADIKDGFHNVFNDFGGADMNSHNSEQVGHGGHETNNADISSHIDGLQMLGHSHPNMISSSGLGDTNDGFKNTQETNFHVLPLNSHSESHTEQIGDDFNSGTLALLGIDPRTIEPGLLGEQSGIHQISFGTSGDNQQLSNGAQHLPLHSSTTTTLKFDDDSLISAQSGTIFSQTPLTSSGQPFHQTEMLTPQLPNAGHHDTHVTFDTSAQTNSASGPTVFSDIPRHDDIFGEDFNKMFSQQSQSDHVRHVPIGQDVFHNQQSPVTTQEELSILAQFPSVNDIGFNHNNPGH